MTAIEPNIVHPPAPGWLLRVEQAGQCWYLYETATRFHLLMREDCAEAKAISPESLRPALLAKIDQVRREQRGGAFLTDRELDVLQGLASGRTNEGIAAWLGISPETIRSHAYRVRGKLGAANAAHAVALGYQQGWL